MKKFGERKIKNFFMDKTTVNLKGKVYPVEYRGDKIKENLLTGILFKVLDPKVDNTIGCIACYVSATVIAIWRNNWNKEFTEEVMINIFKMILPHIDSPVGIDILKQKYPSCIKVIITSGDRRYDQNENAMYIRGRDNPESLIQEFVYDGKPEDSEVEQEVLKILYGHWLESYNTEILVKKLEDRLFIPQKTLFRNLDFLEKENLIDSIKADQGWVSVGITSAGIKYVRNKFQKFSLGSKIIIGDQIKGDKITAKTSGSSSPVIIKSQNISIAFEEIEAEIKTTDISNKQEILVLLDQLKQEVMQKNDPEKIKGLLGEIKKKGSWLNKKILSHPLLAQLMAQALAKTMGIV